MARINIEDSFWSDHRYTKFLLKIGCEATAIGYVIMVMRTAQRFWIPQKKGDQEKIPIPREAWIVLDVPKSIIDCGLVKEVENGFYFAGSESHFEWWFKARDEAEYQRESGRIGGRMSARRHRDALGRLLPNHENFASDGKIHPSDVQGLSKAPPMVVQVDPTFSSSSSSSSSSSYKNNTYTREAGSSNPLCTPLVEKALETQQEKNTETRADIERIVDALNLRLRSKYRSKSEATAKWIRARLADGYEFEDFKTVIESKANEWLGTDQAKFLRPETLFGNKFEGYINAAKLSDAPRAELDSATGELDAIMKQMQEARKS